MERAIGIELRAVLNARKLLILLNEKNDKNTEYAQVRYTPGTRKFRRIDSVRLICLTGLSGRRHRTSSPMKTAENSP